MLITQRQKIWDLVKFVIVVLILSLILKLLLPTLTSPEFKDFVKRLGIFGPLVVVAYIIISHVVAPLAGTPGVLLSAAVFGIYQTVFYIYLAGLISAVINFWLSRRFGRRWVLKLVGQKTMREVDQFVKASGTRILILSRLFGFALFEVISYAAGLTKINFKKYFLITAFFSAIPAAVFAYFFRQADLTSARSLLWWLGAITMTGIIFSIFIKRFIDNLKQK